MSKKNTTIVTKKNNPNLMTAEEYFAREKQQKNPGLMTAEEYFARENQQKEQRTRQNQAYGIATGNLNGIYNSAKTTEAIKKNNAANSALMGTYAGTYVAGKNNEGYLDYLLHGQKEQKDRLEVNKGKWVTQNQGLNRSSGKQDRDAAAGMIGNAAGIKRAGTVTDNKTYTGNNAIEEEEIDAEDFERMLQDREAGNQQVPVKNMLDRPFNELTMEDQKKDPNSKINKHFAEKARLTADRESHLNIVPDEYEGTFHNENEQFHNYVAMDKTEQEVQDFVRGIEMGVYDDAALANYDYDYMSDRGLQMAWNEFDRLEKEAIRRADEAEAQDMNYDENLEIIEKAYYEIEFYQEQKRNIEGAQNRRKEYADLNSVETDGGYEWNPEEYDRGQGNYDWGNIDNIVSFINGGEAYEFYLKSERYNRYAQTGEYDENWFPEVNRKFNNAMMMLPEEKEILTQLYMDDVANGREPTQAKAYLEGLQPYLNMRYRRYEQEYNEEFASVLPVLSVGMDIGSSVMAPVQLIGTAIGAATGDKGVTDPNSGWYFWQRFSEDIENKQARDLGDTGAFYYRAFMSGAKNMARSSATMGLGGLQAAADLLMFASECFMTDFRQQLDYTNGDVGRAAKHAAVEAGNETLWEILPTEARLGTNASAWLYLGNNLFSEIAEEFLGSRIGPRMQALFGNTNEWELRAGQILYEGGYTDENGNWIKLPDDDLKAALDQMNREWWNETITAMESAAISTGGSMGYYGLNNSLQTNRTGRTAIRSGIDVKSMDTETVAGKEWENRLRLVEAGEKMAPGTKSYQKAAQIRKDLESGKKVSYRDYGNLVRTIMSETTENIQSIVQEEAGRVFEQDLQGMGVKGKQLDELRDSAVRLVAGTYTQEDIRAMVKNKALQDVIKMYSMEDKYEPTRESVKTKIETPASVRDVVDSLMNPVQEGPNKFDGLTKDATVATQEELDSADGERTNNYAEAIVQGTISDITGITVNKVKDKPAQITITTADGRTVDASEAQAVNINVAKIIALAQKDGGRTTSTKMLNTLLKYAETTDNMPEMMREAQKIRWAVIMDRATPKTSLSQNVAAEILQGAREDFEAAENERLKNNVDLKPGQGRARFGDAEYGTKEFNDALKGLNSYQRREAQIVAKMAKSAGLDLEIINDPEMDATFGQYAGGARIMVNLAGTNSAGSYHSIVVSLGHEITHMLEENSREGYAALRKYVLNTLEGRGFNLQQRIQDKMDTYEHYNKNLDIYGAIYEVVAEGCDQILTSREAIRTLMKDDPKLYNRIQRAVYRLTTQIRNAMASITGSASYEAKALMDKVDEIAKLWSKAFEEVKGVHGTEETGSKGSYSLKTYTKEEIKGIEKDKRNIVYDGNRSTFTNFYNRGLNAKNNIEKMYFGKIDNALATRIRKDTGVNVEDYDLVLGNYEIKKISVNDHGDAIKEAQRGQVVIGEQELFDAIDVITNYDSAELSPDKYMGLDLINFKKNINGVETVATYAATGKGELRIQTVYKGINKNGSITTAGGVTSPSLTSGTTHGLTSTNNIPQQGNNSNTKSSLRDDSYMAAVERGDMKTAQRLVDEAAMEAFPDSILIQNGKFRKMWHHTNKDFNEFLPGTSKSSGGLKGIYFTPQEYSNMANLGTKHKQFFLNVRNLKFAFGIEADKVYVNKLRDMQEGVTDREEIARINRQFMEETGVDAFFDWQNGWYNIMTPEQIKSADPVVYDDNGNVIPLSERFNKENPDIRYSVRDDSYMAAVNSGDTDAAQRLVDEAAKEAGYTELKYHGTYEDFNVFDYDAAAFGGSGLGFYFGSDSVANSYANFPSSRRKGRVISAYLKTDNLATDNDHRITPDMVDKALARFDLTPEETYKAKPDEYGNTAEEFVSKFGDRQIMYLIEEWAWYGGVKQKYYSEYEGLENVFSQKEVLDNMRDIFKYDGMRNDFETVVWDNRLIKSADPVVYDDNGDVIPLSERFNRENEDIRYSVRDDSYMDAVERGDMDAAQRLVDERAKEAGYTIKAYHGTPDARNVGNYFDPEKAITGPMPFFTENESLAEEYAHNKQLPYETYFEDQYKVDGVPVVEWWDGLTREQKSEIAQKARAITRRNGDIVIDKNDKNSPAEFDELVDDFDGNVMLALSNKWLDSNWISGEKFMEIFDLLGIDNAEYVNPRSEKVYSTYLKIQNPFDVSTMYTREFLEDLEDWWMFNGSRFEEKPEKTGWHKNNVNVYDWVAAGIESDIPYGNTTNWTMIPDGVVEYLKELGYDGIRDRSGKFGGDKHLVWIPFTSEQIKSADPVTYDDNGNVIPLSERFNKENPDIRYSLRDEEIRNEDGDVLAEEFAQDSITKYSLRTWEQTDIAELTKQLIERGFKKKDVTKWIRDVNGIAKMIADNRDRLDYEATSGRMLKNNQEYIKTLDASTLCAKRLLYQGIYNEIQHMLPDTPLMPEDLIRLINMMKKRGLVTPCGICYVESRRRMLGKYASEWLKNYDGEYKPTLEEVTTTDGLEALRNEPEGSAKRQAYDDFVAAMNAKGSANPKVVQLRTDYKPGEIRDMTASQVQKVKDIGGLRVQSFSDFEVVHMIDMMQAVLDMAAMDLTSQAYTKVPEFAWVFGGTGIKINLSLIGKGTGVDAEGNLLFDDVEGMPFEKAMELRRAYSKNVGTILVGMNDEHIIAAMGSDDIDFIIPFHKSGWSKREMGQVIGMASYKDYTRFQNEKLIAGKKANGRGYQTIPNKKSKISNLTPVGKEGYWQFKKDGIWNAENYLKKCAEQHRMPKFANFLIDNGDGSFRLPTEQEAAESKRMANIRKGYWKLLIDFKMYDNEGNGAKQVEVRPDFNMEKAQEILENYEGGANKLPSNHALAQEFVDDYRQTHRNVRVNRQLADSEGSLSIRDEMDFDVKHWMMSVNENSLQTEAEKVLLRQFKDLNMKEQLYRLREEDYRKRIQALESRGEENLDKDAKYELQGLRVRLANATKIKEQTQAEMGRITSSEGYGRMMRDQNRIFNDFMYGRTQAEVTDAVERLEKSSREIEKIIRENQAAVAEMEKSEVIQRLKKALGKTTIDQAAADLKKAFSSTWTRNEIKTYLEPILVKLANGESIESDVATLAGILIESDSRNTYENLSALRGLTIRVGRGMLKELRAQNSSIKEIRARLAGTGITVVTAKDGESSTLEQDLESLREEYPGMPDFGNEKDALENFVSWVEGMKRQSGAQEFYDERLAEAMATIMQKVIGTASGIYIPAEARAQAQVLELVEYVKTLQARTEAAERTLEQLAQRAGQLHTEGLKAAGMANTLTTNVNEALEYFNTTAKLAVAQAKQNRQNQIIDQLKSDFAKKMAKSNEEWRNLIERDRNARAQAEQNRKYRNQIRTVLKRAYNKLRSPKGMDNVPEYMQGLARELIGTFVDNDLAGGMRFTDSPREALQEIRRVLDAWDAESGKFNLADLNDAEEVVATIINQDLMTIYDGIAAINSEIRGKNKLDTLQQRGAILQQIQEATSEIWSAIRAENTVQVQKRRIAVEDQAYKIAMAMGNRQAREWTGKAGNAIRAMRKAIVSGNMTPEYFFRALKNAGLTDLWENYHEAENRNGLELAKAKAKLAEIAEKYGYETWDTDQKVTLTLASGHQVKMTVGQLMSLYATWRREMTLGPDISQHLAGGGFFAEQDTRDGILGREVMEKRAHRISVTKDSDGNITGSPDMAMVESMLTKEQVDFVNEVVAFMSTDMSEIGNEASMAAYGIKLYKEGYYFPFQMWDGVRSRKSNDSGSAAAAQDRAFHPSFSKSRKHGANNALVIGDFMRTVTDHVAGMINYATMGLANESLQKTLNTQLKEEYGPDEINKRNIWAMMEEAYGRDAVQYLRELQQQLNGGAVRTTKSIGDKAISLFRKNAVAGSLSVAFQQPLSYIRAAMMISPRYLTQALAREYWQGSYKELMAHSGVAVIKDMGRFDMNFGQSARDYLTPDGLESRGRRIWNGITETATVLPVLMDRWTWTRMWVAVKAEQHALHPEMDMKSDEFLDLCGVRFNDIMRRTQVYDSTLVKSANMRSDNYFVKSLTSFMAEPTVTMNVLADAVRSAVQHEQGSGRLVRYAAGTFVVSAVMQALIKALFSSGRTPDEKKTWAENFLYRFGGNLISEMDPLQLIPGYSDLITLLKDGKLNDDAMGAIGKIYTSTKGVVDMVLGNKEFGHRNLEDSIGQLVQLFTGLPAKNIMRDGRAMYNLLSEWTVGNPAYAQRANSGAVIRGQFTESLVNADNLIGLIIKELGEAGYETNNAAYYERIYQAKKEGRDEDAQNMIDYLLLGKGVKQSAIDNGVKKAAKADEDASVSEKAEFMMDEGADAGDYIKEQLKNGEIGAKEATGLLKKQYPDKSDDEIFWMVDRIEYQKETGNEVSGQYYRFYDAMETNKAEDIRREVETMLKHGMKRENIKTQITKKYKPMYLAADNKGKTQIRDEIHKAYKALGYSAEDADKVINKWK